MSARSAPNLRQISARCGFSTCTVSRVLSGRAGEFRITKATEQKVLKVARAAGYRPNYLAHSLNTGRTHTVGLLLANRVDHYLGSILDGVEARLRGTPNRIVVATCENDPRVQRQELDAFAYRQVDGIILYPLARPAAGAPARGARRDRRPGVPTVVIGRRAPWRGDEVMLNDEQAGREAARCALQAGARRFAVVTNFTDCSSDRQRVEAFRSEVRRAGCDAAAVTLVDAARLEQLRPESLARVEAFFGVNSGALLALLVRLRGTRTVPARCLVSIGEIEGGALLSPVVRTLPMPGRELGWQAADLMLWRLQHPAAAPQQRVVDFASPPGGPAVSAVDLAGQ